MTRHLPVPRTSDDAEVTRLKVALNGQLVDGGKAITVQTFAELNSKSGDQYEVAQYLPSADAADLLIVTGSQPVIIKVVDFVVDGDGVQFRLFKNPDATADGALTGYCLNADIGAQPETTVHVSDTVTNEGTPVTPLVTIIGSSTPGSASSPTASIRGLERILAPNTQYLLRRNSLTDAQSQRMSFYMTWYEGPLSTNVELVE
jgi:hypothetical protein